MNEERRTPEELLSALKREENLTRKGHLKIFLGMSAGVGKTFAMLEEAHELQRKGMDVAVGIVDTHGRRETALLLDGLKTIPEKSITYKGQEFKELDVDAILRLRPKVVLIDEFAHSNIPGSRHAKRWQDILEILDSGINVYTTLNVQHIESLNDTIRRIVDISVRETVPDLIIENATSIQLVDLTPDELLQRLKEGKVYLGDQSKIASLHFFQRDKLSALREVALRYAAEKIDSDLRYSLPTSEHTIEWKPREKLLVAVSPSPYSQKLIRTSRRLAANIKAPWVAVHVNNGQTLNEKDNNQLIQNLQLAQDLGAEVITINSPDIAEGIQRVARKKGITQIILGRAPKITFFDVFRQTLVDRLSTECTDIDIHVIGQDPLLAKQLLTKYRQNFSSFSIQKNISSYILVFFYVCLLALANWAFLSIIGYKVVGVIFLIGILGLSLFFKKGPIFFASILYAFIWDFFFIPPVNQFVISSYEDIALLALYVLTAIATGILVDRAREHKELLVKNETSTQLLYDISQQITVAKSPQDVFNTVKQQLKKSFNWDVEILPKPKDNKLMFIDLTEDNEKNTAVWVFGHGKEAGWSTDTLPSSKNLYIPLKGFYDVLGILIFKPATNKFLDSADKTFLYNVCRQITGYLERLFAEERVKQHEQLKQIENIHKTTLDHVSDEFQAPLKDAKKAINKWKDKISQLENVKPDDLKEVSEVEKAFNVFHKILSNISAMAQLSEGMIPLKKSTQSVQELIEECCNDIKKSKNHHQINITIQEKLPLISFDFYLMQILLYNLLMNAFEYSPPASTIRVEAKTTDGFLIISVSDEGKGIPEDQLNAIFEKFYRLPEETTPGVGLGLAIAKSIADAHHGYLKAENLSSGGAKFSLFLPMESKSKE